PPSIPTSPQSPTTQQQSGSRRQLPPQTSDPSIETTGQPIPLGTPIFPAPSWHCTIFSSLCHPPHTEYMRTDLYAPTVLEKYSAMYTTQIDPGYHITAMFLFNLHRALLPDSHEMRLHGEKET